MNLRSIDLNLLVILDALLDEAHVSRAARRLHLSQPAVSSALQRCRDLMGDALLERGRGTMYRTSRGESLRAPLKSLLRDVQQLVDPPEVSLCDVRQTIRIVSADLPATLIARPLLSELHDGTPGIDVAFKPWQGNDAAQRALFEGDADLALSVIEREVEGLEHQQVLFEESIVAMRRDHPAAEDFNIDTWLSWPHIVISGKGEGHSNIDTALQAQGRSRRVGLVVPFFQMVPDLLIETDLIALLPSSIIKREIPHLRHGSPRDLKAELAVFPPPFKVDPILVHLAWHRRRNDDRVLQHVKEIVVSIFERMANDRSEP